MLPAFGVTLIDNILFEYVMAKIIGSYALFRGYRKLIRSFTRIFYVLPGFFFLLAKQAGHSAQLGF